MKDAAIRNLADMAYRSLIGWVGIAGLLVTLFFPLVVWSGTEVCGYPATNRVTILRGEETVATFLVIFSIGFVLFNHKF